MATLKVALELGNNAGNITSPYDGTALIEAVILGDGGSRHQVTVKHLVEAGANRSMADRDGVTPLEHAKQRGFAEIVALLGG